MPTVNISPELHEAFVYLVEDTEYECAEDVWLLLDLEFEQTKTPNSVQLKNSKVRV